MQTVVIVIHLMIVLTMIGVVLLQKSEEHTEAAKFYRQAYEKDTAFISSATLIKAAMAHLMTGDLRAADRAPGKAAAQRAPGGGCGDRRMADFADLHLPIGRAAGMAGRDLLR